MGVNITYRPNKIQQAFHDACDDTDIFQVVLNSSRQLGKSLALIFQANKYAVEDVGCDIIIVSPSDAQVKKLHNDLFKIVGHTSLISRSSANSGNFSLTYTNGSSILFKSALAEASLRGYSAHYLFIDEAAFVDEETLNLSILPWVATTGKKLIMTSTPKGKNHFWSSYLLGQSDDHPRVWSITGTYKDNPLANLDIINQFKEAMPPEHFKQEFEGAFIDAAGVFQNVDGVCILEQQQPDPSQSYYAGVDVAFANDYTVVSILNSKGKQVALHRINQLRSRELRQWINNILTPYSPKKIYIERNNQGLTLIQDMEDEYPELNIKGFNTTATSKPKIIHQMIAALNNKTMVLIDDKQQKLEMNAFGFKLSANGRIQFAGTKGINDDTILANAIALECLATEQNNGTYHFSW